MQREVQLPPLEEDPERIAELADDIVARSEFNENLSLWQRFVRWLNERLGAVDPDPNVGDPTVLSGPAQVLLISAAVLTVAFVLWRIYKSWTGLPKKVKEDEDDVEASQVGQRRSVVDWSEEARAHEAAGRWAEAIRCWYRVSVARLADRDLVRDIPGRTSGEYRYEVSENAPDIAPTFDAASDVFDAVWYGGEPASPAQSERVKALSGAVGEKG